MRRLRGWPVDLNDARLVQVLEQDLGPDSNCIDVGAHRGAVLQHFVRLAPGGRHLAVEPLPEFAATLRLDFPGVRVLEVALAARAGRADFQYVVTNPAYSGLRKRRYDRPDERLKTISVQVQRLDDLIDSDERVDFVKIDVEGGELGVLQGARRTLARSRPIVAFEHGLGAADYYGSTPADLYRLLGDELGYEIFTLADWLLRRPALELAAMVEEFESCRSYMFLARPKPSAPAPVGRARCARGSAVPPLLRLI